MRKGFEDRSETMEGRWREMSEMVGEVQRQRDWKFNEGGEGKEKRALVREREELGGSGGLRRNGKMREKETD